ncbi:MAG TPA: 50S ribosomal protein L10 [Patescibacteria group bacterium]|nr:50S ribosomal protein L10 [Patescibacteria group bacterium]
MPNEKNIKIVDSLSDKVNRAKSLVFADFQGLGANITNDLRSSMKDTQAEIQVAKNTLLKIALKDKKDEILESDLKGSTLTVFSYGDAIAPLKILMDFAKKFEALKVKAGLIDGKYTTAQQLDTLSNLPGREQLLTQIVGTMKSPINGFANVLAGSQRKLVYVLRARRSSLEGE